MDPPHLTEFASPRYFEKLQQQGGHGEAGQYGPATEESPFNLPVRSAPVPDLDPTPVIHKPQECKKRRWALFRRQGSKPGSSEDNQPPRFINLPYHLRHRSSLADAVPEFEIQPTQHRQPLPFDELFLGLPPELQIQVIEKLPLSDVLSLRLVSRAWHSMITVNESTIVRYHLNHHVPAYAKRLYPLSLGTRPTLRYLCGIWHRLHVAAKLSYVVSHWVTTDIFLLKKPEQQIEFAPQRERMRRRLIPIIFTIFHFFERLRELGLEYLGQNGYGLNQTPFTFNPIERRIMEEYDPHTLLRVHELFPTFISAYLRRLRPPSYVGGVERTFRGYLKSPPSNDVHVTSLVVGGLRQACQFWETKGYNARIDKVDKWYHNIMTGGDPQPPKRRWGLSKKKSFMPDTSKSIDAQGHILPERRLTAPKHLESSLADGIPMPPLPQEELKRFIQDLPNLRQIWCVTAEALLLEKGIVENAGQIRRNGHVMLELIRSDGWDDEDEWWYGREISESVQPAEGATDDTL